VGLNIGGISSSTAADIAAIPYGEVGSFVWATYGGAINPGTIVSGASLNPSGAQNGTSMSFGNNIVSAGQGTALTGSWKCLGYSASSITATLFVRVA
jgi:hypothetical protein